MPLIPLNCHICVLQHSQIFTFWHLRTSKQLCKLSFHSCPSSLHPLTELDCGLYPECDLRFSISVPSHVRWCLSSCVHFPKCQLVECHPPFAICTLEIKTTSVKCLQISPSKRACNPCLFYGPYLTVPFPASHPLGKAGRPQHQIQPILSP